MGTGAAYGFDRVDQTTRPEDFIAHLNAIGANAGIRQLKEQTVALLGLRPGQRALDVGCGTGADALALAAAVAPGGQAVGLDASQTLIAEARARIAGGALPVEYVQGDAVAMPFPTASFDASRADRVFHHLRDPLVALGEMARVTRAGGRIAVTDTDWGLLGIDSEDRELTRALVNFRCDSLPNGWMGRHLPALFRRAGLQVIAVVPHTLLLTSFAGFAADFRLTCERAVEAGIAEAGSVRRWLDDLRGRGEEGTFLACVTLFTVLAERP